MYCISIPSGPNTGHCSQGTLLLRKDPTRERRTTLGWNKTLPGLFVTVDNGGGVRGFSVGFSIRRCALSLRGEFFKYQNDAIRHCVTIITEEVGRNITIHLLYETFNMEVT